MSRLFRIVAFFVAAATAVALIFTAQVGAQLQGGPLWWVPDNDPDWSRHHDRWLISPIEVVAAGAATSFPARTWVSSEHLGRLTSAPPNSACDYMNDTEYDFVGPPDRDRQDNGRTSRTPPEWGGAGGLQQSVHIGEYWQGRVFRDYMTNPASSATHRALYPGWDPFVYGSFDVRTRTRSGGWVTPMWRNTGPWIRFPSDLNGPFHLSGGGGMTLACAGAALVMMHGAEGGSNYGVYPTVPRDVDGNPCYSTARLVVLRAQSEGRCEPDLRERYDLSERFYDLFDPATETRTIPELVAQFGATRTPLFPTSQYGSYMPHVMGRRVELGLFTVAEFASADLEPVPWDTPPYPGSDAAARRARLERFVDPATRPDAFGGEPVRFADYTGAADADSAFEDCLELGPAGWDAATGTFDPRCRPDEYTTPYAGFINHESDVGEIGTRAPRTPEVGPRDNRSPIGGGATIRTFAGLWDPPDGFAWFRHERSDLGCLYMAYTPDWNYLNLAESLRWGHVNAAMALIINIVRQPCPLGPPDEVRACEAAKSAALRRAEEHMRFAFGWRLIGEYRDEVDPEMRAAFASGAYAVLDGIQEVVFRGTSTGLRNGACYTGPVGAGGFNTRLAPVFWVHGQAVGGLGSLDGDDGRAGYLVPGHSGRTWYGEPLEVGVNEHEAAGGGQVYGYHTEVRGEATVRAREAAIATAGVATPYPQDLAHDYASAVGVRDTPYSFRDFACPTAGSGYYGMGVSALGPERQDHRENPAAAWRDRDARIDETDAASRYPTGTPCIPEDASNPLAPYYNTRGMDDGLRCHESEADADGNFVPSPTSVGAYSTADFAGGDAARWVLEYSGDGADVTLQPSLERQLRPTSYVVLPDSAARALGARGSQNITFSATYGQMSSTTVGFLSLDVERHEIWRFWPQGWDYRIGSEEAYAGLAPGWAGTDQDAAPADAAWIQYDGPVRFFGAMGLSGSGGCTLGPAPSLPDDGDQYHIIRSILDPQQHVVCILPTDSAILQPTGACPNPSVF